MVVLSNPGTYGTSSGCPDIHRSKDPEYNHPTIPKSRTPKIQNPKLFTSTESCKQVCFFGFLEVWISGILEFWIFGFLDFGVFVFYQIWIRTKTAFVSVFTVFLRGVRVVRGVTIYIYMYRYSLVPFGLGALNKE